MNRKRDNIYQLICSCSLLFGVSEEAFLRATDDVMLTLIDNINTFISWPEKREYSDIAQEFDHMGRWVKSRNH